MLAALMLLGILPLAMMDFDRLGDGDDDEAPTGDEAGDTGLSPEGTGDLLDDFPEAQDQRLGGDGTLFLYGAGTARLRSRGFSRAWTASPLMSARYRARWMSRPWPLTAAWP